MTETPLLRCTTCKEHLPAESFALSHRNARGRQYNCRTCQATIMAKRAAAPGAAEVKRQKRLEAEAVPGALEARRAQQRAYRATAAGQASLRASRAKSVEQRRAWQAEWNAANKDRRKAQGAAWYEAHKEQKAAQGAAWIEANRDRRRDHYENRRARKEEAFVEDVNRTVVWDRDGGICHICKEPADPANWHLDHVRPLAKGGEHSYANTAVSHPVCNKRKAASLSHAQ